MRHILRIAAVTVLLLLMAAPVAGKRLTHADYARSEPAADEVVATPPAEVKVWFTQELFRREGENWLHVIGPDGARVDVEPTTVDDNDRTLLRVALVDGLADGTYTVEWRALSADDGHAKEDVFVFSVGTPSADQPSAAPATEETATPQPEPEATSTPQPAADPPAEPPADSPAQEESGSAPAGGLPCLGSAPLAVLAVGAILLRRRQSTDF